VKVNKARELKSLIEETKLVEKLREEIRQNYWLSEGEGKWRNIGLLLDLALVILDRMAAEE
jgi:hypothetical protein